MASSLDRFGVPLLSESHHTAGSDTEVEMGSYSTGTKASPTKSIPANQLAEVCHPDAGAAPDAEAATSYADAYIVKEHNAIATTPEPIDATLANLC